MNIALAAVVAFNLTCVGTRKETHDGGMQDVSPYTTDYRVNPSQMRYCINGCKKVYKIAWINEGRYQFQFDQPKVGTRNLNMIDSFDSNTKEHSGSRRIYMGGPLTSSYSHTIITEGHCTVTPSTGVPKLAISPRLLTDE